MILVTGGTGHLGSHVLYELVKKNRPVRAIYRNIDHLTITREVFSYYEPSDDLFNKIEWAEADINDYYTLHTCLKGITQVFHTAGYVSFNDKESLKLNHVNAEGTANIVNACLETGNISLCYVSSIAALGKLSDGIPVNETILWNQGGKVSAYSKSKYQAEMEVWRGIHEGLNAVIVNPSVIIGPGMWLGPGRNLWKSVQKGLNFYADGSAGYVDVRDVAAVMVWLTDQKISGERYILNSGHMSNREFLEILAGGLKTKAPQQRITPFISELALLFESVRAFIAGSEKRFNRRTFKIATSRFSYSNEKIRLLSGFDFLSVEESLKSATDIYGRLKQKKF